MTQAMQAVKQIQSLMAPLRRPSNSFLKGADSCGISGMGTGLNVPPGEFAAMAWRP